MATDAGIILQTNPVQSIDPIKTVSQLLAVKNAQIENAVRQQQIQQAAAQTQDIQAQAAQRQKEVTDQNTLQEIMRDPVQGPKVAGGDFSGVMGKVSPEYLDKVRQSTQAYHTQLAANTKTDLENANTAAGQATDAITGLKQLGDVDRINAELPNTVQRLTDAGVLKALKIDPASAPKSISSTDDLDAWAAHMGVLQAATGKALALKQEQEKQLQTKSEIQKNTSQGTEAQSKADLSNFELNLRKNFNPATLQSGVDELFPTDPQFAAAKASAVAIGKLAMASTGKPEDARAAVEKVYNEQVVPNLPATIAGKAATSKAEATSTAPIHQAESVAVANANRAGAEHIAAQGDYQKSLTELNNSAADSQRLHNLIAAAQGGNKAAPALVPIAEIRGFLNRINGTELRSVSSQAGSLADQIQGWVQGKTEGQPVPPEILKATDELATLQTQQAEQKHAGGVKAINIARGENFTPRTAADLGYGGPSKTGGFKAGDTKVVGGHTYKRDDGGTWHLQP